MSPSGVYPRTRKPLASRFWPKVHKTETCWLWTGGTTKDGYGILADEDGTLIYAHRAAWKLTHGDPGDQDVLHRCDNPPCVNPDDLFLGSAKDNGQDMAKKRRGTSTLSPEQVREVRALSKSGVSMYAIADRFGLSQAAIWYVVRRKTYTHVEDAQ
jgi:HNH endonuclease